VTGQHLTARLADILGVCGADLPVVDDPALRDVQRPQAAHRGLDLGDLGRAYLPDREPVGPAALDRAAIERGQDDPGDDQDHDRPGRGREEQPQRKRISAHRAA